MSPPNCGGADVSPRGCINSGAQVPSVIKKYQRVALNSQDSIEYWEDLSKGVDERLRDQWEAEILQAERGRVHKPQKMDILGNQLKNCK
jgi:hypothetical protein